MLVVAGSLKRADPDRQENEVLMRALRDFNTPKIVTDDLPVFMGLIGDLFPAMNVPRKRDPKFEASVKEATESLGLQPEDNFVLKVRLGFNSEILLLLNMFPPPLMSSVTPSPGPVGRFGAGM